MAKNVKASLISAFLDDYLESWQKHGAAALDAVRIKRPYMYVRMVALLASKDQDPHTEDGRADIAREVEEFIAERRRLAASKLTKVMDRIEDRRDVN